MFFTQKVEKGKFLKSYKKTAHIPKSRTGPIPKMYKMWKRPLSKNSKSFHLKNVEQAITKMVKKKCYSQKTQQHEGFTY